MRFGKQTLAAISALALMAAPAVAQAAETKAKPVSSKVKRVGNVAAKENKLGGGNGTIIAIVAAAAVILGIVLLSDDSDSP
jgi:uncharacterized membrane protein